MSSNSNGNGSHPPVESFGRGFSRTSPADTAHLVGPGCLKIRGRLPEWRPVNGTPIVLHPEYLKRVFLYGVADVSGTVLRFFWRRGIQVAFLSPGGNAILGRLQPVGKAPNLPNLQHLAAADLGFRLAMAQQVVQSKIESTLETTRYYQQQGRGQRAGRLLRTLKKAQAQVVRVKTLNAVRGIEGSAASGWVGYFTTLLPAGWEFPGRRAHPPTDPVNSLLSLGYTLLATRCQTFLAAADLDPLCGFLHDLRPGRPSLACDLMEPLRVPLVDRLVLAHLARGRVTVESFRQQGAGWRLQPDAFKAFLSAFETAFREPQAGGSWEARVQQQIDRRSTQIRQYHHPRPGQPP